MVALDTLNEASCPRSIDLPWHFSLMIYDMVTLSVLVASYAADLTLIFFFFFELHFIPQSTIKKSQRGICSMHCTSFKLAPFLLTEKRELDWQILSGRTMINNTRQSLPLLEYSLTTNITWYFLSHAFFPHLQKSDNYNFLKNFFLSSTELDIFKYIIMSFKFQYS